MLKNTIRRNALGLVLCAGLFLYYFSLLAAWPRLARILSALLTALPPFSAYAVFTVLLLVLPLSMKMDYLRPRRRWRTSFKLILFLLVPLFGLAVAAAMFLKPAQCFAFFDRHHLPMFAVASVLFSAALGASLCFGADVEEFMDGFKTFPLLSPIMCFSGPALWKDGLTKFGLTTTSIKVPSILLVVSGFIFLLSFFLFWLGKAYKKRQVLAENAVVLDPTGAPARQRDQNGRGLFVCSAALSFLALPALFTAVLELAREITKS